LSARQITVLICAFNRAEVLLECLRRLEMQTFRDFDVVVVDDGSTDDTLAQARAFAAASILPMQVLTKPNGGLGNARNFGLQFVTAPVTLSLGHDIWPHPRFVEEHLRLHRDHPEERTAVVGLSRYFDPDRQITPYERYLESNGAQFSYGKISDGDRLDWHFFYTGNLSAKTSLLRRYPSNEEIFFLEDAALGYRISQDGGLTVIYNARAVADHYHPASVAWSFERLYRAGQDARRLVTTEPGLREEFEVRGSQPQLRLYRWLAARHGLWRVVARIMQPLSRRWAMAWFAGKALRLNFFAGYEGLAPLLRRAVSVPSCNESKLNHDHPLS
jgi:glycosyltransferase involved in cell wall biosynthesis